jgi:Glyoxalase-like domain
VSFVRRVFVTLDSTEPRPLAELLGAVSAQFQPAPEARRIMLDPAGHPFCLTTGIPKI